MMQRDASSLTHDLNQQTNYHENAAADSVIAVDAARFNRELSALAGCRGAAADTTCRYFSIITTSRHESYAC